MKKKDQDPISEIDESLLTPEQKEELHRKPKIAGYMIFFSVMAVLIAACIIVIYALGGPVGS